MGDANKWWYKHGQGHVLGYLLDPFNLHKFVSPPKQEPISRKERRRPQEIPGAESALMEVRRRQAGRGRNTILTGALGPASARGSVLSGGR